MPKLRVALVAGAGLLIVAVMRGALAAPVAPPALAPALEQVYYYHNRYYPYHYHNRYYHHRVWRHNRWYYY